MEKERERILELRRQLERDNYLYYVRNEPVISDEEFDRLMRELEELEGRHPEMADPNSPTRRVGSDVTNEFPQVEHKYGMMSLANTYSVEEVAAFDERVRRGLGVEEVEYVCELKYDGTSISLRYEDGRLAVASTRGDGVKGDDVTANVRTIRTVPLRMQGEGWPREFEIRGEVLMPFAVFNRLNEERLEADCEVRLHAGAEPRLEEERMDVTQGKLALGFRTGGITCWEEDYPALVMCNAVFGATPLSKLFLNVREKRSLCYYASSNLEKMKGLLLVSSGIEFGQYQQARDEILAQLEAVRRGEIEDWELEGARRTLIGGHRSTLDDQSRLEEFWLGQTAAGLDTGIEELVERLKTVTREQVAAAAQKLELDTVYFLNGKEG